MVILLTQASDVIRLAPSQIYRTPNVTFSVHEVHDFIYTGYSHLMRSNRVLMVRADVVVRHRIGPFILSESIAYINQDQPIISIWYSG
ncbi:MAG: hypothetical protein ABNH29_16695 [Paracoccus sp. (in: a-proteobacteria)]|jgi:hypothetical protein